MSSIFLQQFFSGFLVKSIASFDDTLTRIPLLAEITRGRVGKVAFSLGTLLALTVILLVVMFFSSILAAIPNRRLLVAGMILVMAVVVYLGLLSPKKEEKIQRQIKQTISHARFAKLAASGFVISFITYLDDMVVLIPLFLDGDGRLFTLLGVYLAALVQIILVIYFSRQIAQMRYKKEVASLALVTLAVLVGWGVI